MTGITVARQFLPTGEVVYTCVLDEPTSHAALEDGAG
jgi:hypothetical protein